MNNLKVTAVACRWSLLVVVVGFACVYLTGALARRHDDAMSSELDIMGGRKSGRCGGGSSHLCPKPDEQKLMCCPEDAVDATKCKKHKGWDKHKMELKKCPARKPRVMCCPKSKRDKRKPCEDFQMLDPSTTPMPRPTDPPEPEPTTEPPPVPSTEPPMPSTEPPVTTTTPQPETTTTKPENSTGPTPVPRQRGDYWHRRRHN